MLAETRRHDVRMAGILLHRLAFGLFFCNHFLLNTCFNTATIAVPLGSLTLPLPNLLDAVTLALLVTRYVLQRPSPLGACVSASIVAIGLLPWMFTGSPGDSWLMTGRAWLFWIAVFVVASEGVHMSRVTGLALALTAGLLLVTVTCAKLGVIEDYLYPRDDGVREAAGFYHSNICGYYAVLACVSASALSLMHGRHREARGFVAVVAVYLAALALNLALSQSRTATVVWAVALAAYGFLYFVRSRRARLALSVALSAGVAVGAVASLFLMVAFDPSNSTHAFLDQLLSGRPSLSHHYLELGGPTPFGTSYMEAEPVGFDHGAPQWFLVDNSWCRLFLGYGIIPTAVLLAGEVCLYLRLLRRMRDQEDDTVAPALLFGLTIAGIYALSENVGIRLEWNYFLLALGPELLYAPRSPFRSGVSILDAYGLLPASFRRAVRPLRRGLSGGTSCWDG